MLKKIGLIICLLLATVTLVSCGDSMEANADIEAIEISHSMPKAFGGSTTVEQAADYIYLQQISLCEAYYKTYQQTDVSKYIEKYPEVNSRRLTEKLNNKRQELNGAIAEEFYANINKIIEDVTDCGDKEIFADKCYNEARNFFNEYNSIKTATPDDFVTITNILVNHTGLNNTFVKRVLHENREMVLDMAILDIEYNAAQDDDLRANVAKNNDTIDAINRMYGGVEDDIELRDRIDQANMVMLEKLLDTMDITNSERQQMIEQLRELQSAGRIVTD